MNKRIKKVSFLITIDAEGDNLWANPKEITTKNSFFLPRFQDICERYNFKPTWLTNFEMAADPFYVEFAKDVIKRGQGEVGMHLHAWNTPPIESLTENDARYAPYLIEYPEKLLREKIVFMSQFLEDTFSIQMRSHRAGRWAFNEKYAAILSELGFWVDCSVTPLVNWKFTLGDPNGKGGTDYSNFPNKAYFIDPNDISLEGNSDLLQVPMSTAYRHGAIINNIRKGIDKIRGKKRPIRVRWLRPTGNNLKPMVQIAKSHLNNGSDYLEFMLHSSEFMPGGSPTFKTGEDIEKLYGELEFFFSWVSQFTTGATLSEYYLQKRGEKF